MTIDDVDTFLTEKRLSGISPETYNHYHYPPKGRIPYLLLWVISHKNAVMVAAAFVKDVKAKAPADDVSINPPHLQEIIKGTLTTYPPAVPVPLPVGYFQAVMAGRIILLSGPPQLPGFKSL